MAQNKAAIKARIRSINTTQKITKAMEVVSNVKLQKQNNRMKKNREYADVLKNAMSEILNREIEINNDFLSFKNSEKRLFFVYYTDLGLCGGYNLNLNKLVDEHVKSTDLLYVIGTSQYGYLKKQGYHILNEIISSDGIDYLSLRKLADHAITMFRKDEISSIDILYTSFINNVTFAPVRETVLPCELPNEESSQKDLLLEPDPQTIIESLFPMYIENQIYARFLEAKTSEQGARRFAMENATDNAQELNDKLVLQYNQARQSAITQEITEIVSGADAL